MSKVILLNVIDGFKSPLPCPKNLNLEKVKLSYTIALRKSVSTLEGIPQRGN